MSADPQEDRARARRVLAFMAAGYAFVGGAALTVTALFISPERVEAALPIFLAVLSPASLTIGWFKGRDAGHDA